LNGVTIAVRTSPSMPGFYGGVGKAAPFRSGDSHR
jgi:hypothetical protein